MDFGTKKALKLKIIVTVHGKEASQHFTLTGHSTNPCVALHHTF
jgi:hypothetical protein